MLVRPGRVGQIGRTRASGGTPTPTPITLAAPTYYDAFDYTDGTRLVAGDPNANAGLAATNPGNLGWTATASGSANNARFNPIVYQGKVMARTANSFGDFASPAAYLLTAPAVTTPADHYVTMTTDQTGSQKARVVSLATDASNHMTLDVTRAGAILSLSRIANTAVSTQSVSGDAQRRRIGGANGAFYPPGNNETFTRIVFGTKAYVRRGPGNPVGPAAGFTITTLPTGTGLGMDTRNADHAGLASLEMSAVDCVLLHNDTHNMWYPRVQGLGGYANGAAQITFTGTYLGTAPSRLHWALSDPFTGAIVKDWAWVDVAKQTIGGGNWSITIIVPCGANGRLPYNIGVRAVGADNIAKPGTAVFSNVEFAVTYNVALVGQSNSGGLLNNAVSGNYQDYPGAFCYNKLDPTNQASTNAAGYAIGATTITLGSVGTGSILAGEYVQFVGDSNSYLVVTGDADVSNGGSIVIAAPGLLQAIPASATAINRSRPLGTFAATTPYMSSTTNGTGDKMIARYGDILSDALDLPVSFEAMALASTSATNLGPNGANWFYIVQQHEMVGSAFDEIYFSHGENSFVAAGNLWLASWQVNIPAYLALSGQPPGTTIPIYFAFTGRITGANSQNDASTQDVRLAQDQFEATFADSIPTHHYVGVKMVDDFHYTNIIGEGYDEVARRIALTRMKEMTGTGYDGMGPLATTATRAAAVITIDFDLNGATSMTCRNGTDQSLTGTASALTSWQVSTDDFATTKTITTAELIGNQVVITLSADPGGPVKVRNHYGFAPTITSWAFGAYADGSYIGSKPIITPLVSN